MNLYLIIGGVAVVFLFIILKIIFGNDIKKTKPKLHPFGYRMIYTDQKIKCGDDVIVSKLLKSEKFEIQGKPDFLYKGFFGKVIPVELKSGKIGEEKLPHFGDMLQLAAYFLIVEDIYGKRPRYGNLIYSDYMFKIKNTREIRREVFSTIKKMNKMLETGEGEGCFEFAKCRHCLCKGVCQFYGK